MMVFAFSLILILHSLSSDATLPNPMLGDVTSSSAKLFVQNPSSKSATVSLLGTNQSVSTEDTVVQLCDLKPNTTYRYAINGEHQGSWWFTTRPMKETSVRIAFGSCANEKEGSSSVWKRMHKERLDALVLLGDTPYIDTTNLEVQRTRYQEFSAVPAFATLVANTPVYSTWDDHDFGKNDTDGNLEGKENSRQAFLEHRPNPTVGEDGQGIYTNFSMGPVEVFLLDTRWFAQTEVSENNIPTLLGNQQWEWLERKLKASTSPFKILACGMIFNGATRPGKTDHWGAYPTEYYRLLSILKRHSISGVSLVSGDIHWSRVIQHDTKSKIGYDLIEFITSPIHEKLIVTANAPHEGDLFSVGEINSFLLLQATNNDEMQSLSMTITNASGEELFTHTISNQK